MDSEKKHITFIVNPISGTQEKEQIIALINEYLDIDKYTFQIIYTQYAGHAEEIAAQCAEDSHFAVVAVGGDGTVNEVARALTHTHTALGIIPCGSGNGLARHLQISMQPRKAIEAINEGIIEHKFALPHLSPIPFIVPCTIWQPDNTAIIEFATAHSQSLCA